MYFRNLKDRLMSVRRMKSIQVLSTGLGLLLYPLALANVGAAVPQSSSAGQYHLVKKVVLGGDGGWDYFTFDPATHRIFIARGTHTMVVDPEGKLVADIPNTQGAHAVEFAPDLNRAFTSNGSGSSVTIFDPKMYTEPWQGLNKFPLHLLRPDFDIPELLCSPSEMAEYNKQVGDVVLPGSQK